MTEVNEVRGCSSCPFAFLSDGCIPVCVISDESTAADQASGRVCQYTFRDDVPTGCPLRTAAMLIRLPASRMLEAKGE